MSPASSAGIRLRATTADDLDFVLALEHHPDQRPFIGQWTREQHLEAIGRADRGHWLVEREADRARLGYVITYDVRAAGYGVYIKRIAVTEKSRGIGRHALHAVIEHAFGDLGADSVCLAVRHHNARARRSYLAVGFAEASLGPEERRTMTTVVDAIPDDCLIMHRGPEAGRTGAAPLTFDLPDGLRIPVTVTTLFNGGYAGRRQDAVAAHVRELAKLGVPAPSVTPSLYALPPYLAMQTGEVFAPHDRTSGEGEWALIVAGPEERDRLLTVACDHTDRVLEAHGIAWSKQAGPDVLGRKAWRLIDIANRLDAVELVAWADGTEIQRGTLADLLPPAYWLDVLGARGQLRAGTVLLSGTIPMHEGVNQFATSWRVELRDPATGDAIACAYRVRRLPGGIG